MATLTQPRETRAEPEYITIPEFCARFGIGRTSTYILVTEGKLRAIRIGRRVLIGMVSARAFFDSQPDADMNVQRAA